jgi:hypothetical protein
MTLTSAPPGTVHPPLLPVRRPPALEPPCDGDDLVEISAMVGSELPFDWSDPPGSYPGFAEARAGVGAGVDEAERAAAVDAAERYVRVCLETLNGFRPTSHLRTLAGVAPLVDVVSQLARRRNNGPMIRRLDRIPTSLPSSRRPMRFGPPPPSGAADSRFGAPSPSGASDSRFGAAGSTVPGNAGRFSAPGIGRAPRPASPVPAPFRMKRLRHSSPRPGVAEIVAILGHAETTVACAIRMELTDGKWRPTLIQVV